MTGKRTDLLLACGVVATPLFFVVAFAAAATRRGFDLGPHMISQLGTGDLGWIQIANFVVTGTMFVLSSFGFQRVLIQGLGRVWAPRLIAVFGAGLISAGVFVTDPANGYPVGAGEHLTWHGIVHGVAATVSGLALIGALLVFARRFYAAGQKGWAAATVVVAVLYLVLPFSSADQGGVTLAVASIIGWGAISLHALRSMNAFTAYASWRDTPPRVADFVRNLR